MASFEDRSKKAIRDATADLPKQIAASAKAAFREALDELREDEITSEIVNAVEIAVNDTLGDAKFDLQRLPDTIAAGVKKAMTAAFNEVTSETIGAEVVGAIEEAIQNHADDDGFDVPFHEALRQDDVMELGRAIRSKDWPAAENALSYLARQSEDEIFAEWIERGRALA